MDERQGGWGQLLALFRLIYSGHRTHFVRARGGKLFDPEAFPFLEGRVLPADAPRVPGVSDGCLLRILEGLMTLKLRGGTRERLAKDAVYACDGATSAIFALEPPKGAPDALKAEFQTALSACYRAYRSKQNVFQRLTKVLDGDARPSTMQAVQNEMQTAEGHMVTCVPGLMAAVEQATGKFPEPAQR